MDPQYPEPAALLRHLRDRGKGRVLATGAGSVGHASLLRRNPPPKVSVQFGPGWEELGQTWSSVLDDAMQSVRKSLRLAPSALSLVLAVTLMMICSSADPRLVSNLILSIDQKVRSQVPSNMAVRFQIQDGGRASSDGKGKGRYGSLRGEGKEHEYPGGQRMWDDDVKEIGGVYRKFDAIVATTPSLSSDSPVRKRYALLAKLYMTPFPSISRASYMELLEGEKSNGSCTGCFLIQVKNRELFVYDPKQVRTMAEFREIRMREAIHWTTRAVESGAIDNTEFVVSTTDGVVSTSHSHTYRMPNVDPVAHPIFTMTHCNCSENIPFPMTFTDLLRRGFKEQFWKARSGSIARWDQMATDVIGAQTHESHVWAKKRRQAVFRGAIRVPAALALAEDYDKNCDRYGRTALKAKADEDELEMERQQKVWKSEHWFWSTIGSLQNKIGFGGSKRIDGGKASRPNSQHSEYGTGDGRLDSKSFLPLLDVKLSGKCGNRTYTSDNLNMEQQSQYRYAVHVEGNGFWADRLAIQLFGSSAIIKQLTPCGMFFEPLLRAYEHYIPVDYRFNDILAQVKWARDNDDKVHSVVRNARSFAGDYLTVSGIAAYSEEILREYTKRLKAHGKDGKGEGIKIHPHAIKLFPI